MRGVSPTFSSGPTQTSLPLSRSFFSSSWRVRHILQTFLQLAFPLGQTCVDRACLHTDVVYPNSCLSLRCTHAAFTPAHPPLPHERLSASASARAAPQTRPGRGAPGVRAGLWAGVASEEVAQSRSGRAAVDASLGFPSLSTPICLSSVWRTVSVSSLRKAFPLILSLSPTH